MKKNSGFTLIELLAVIVILAIIALIATPTILGVIEKARVGSAKASALSYIDAVEKYMILSQLDETNYPVKLENGKKYKVSSDSTEVSILDYLVESVKAEEANEIILNDILDIKGEKPTAGWLEIKNNEVADYTLKVGEYAVNYDEETDSSVVTKGGKLKEETEENVYKDGTPVYFDPEKNEICDAENAVSTTETKTGCMKWYIFGDDAETSTVNMILDHNTTALVAWNSDKTSKEANEVKIALEKDIETWDSTIASTARLIEADEIADITGASSEDTIKWDSQKEEDFETTSDGTCVDVNTDTEISWFYFDGKGSTYSASENGWQLATAKSIGASKYGWLYDNLSECTLYGCNVEDNEKYAYFDGKEYSKFTLDVVAYWTNTVMKKGVDEGESNNYAWVVEQRGSLSRGTTSHASYMGVRPVITIDKEILG